MARAAGSLRLTGRGALLLAAAGACLAAAVVRHYGTRSAPGSIVPFPTGRANFLAFTVSGRIDRRAIHGMAATLDRAFDTEEVVDVLVDLRDYGGATVGAMADPLSLIAQMRSLRHVRRYAVVGPPAWAGAMINLMDPLLPVEARTFGPEDMQRAMAWAQAGEDPPA